MPKMIVVNTLEPGHKEFSWTGPETKEAEEAQHTFEDLLKGHHIALQLFEGVGKRVEVFDPDAEEIILLPPVSGG